MENEINLQATAMDAESMNFDITPIVIPPIQRIFRQNEPGDAFSTPPSHEELTVTEAIEAERLSIIGNTIDTMILEGCPNAEPPSLAELKRMI